MQSNTEFLKTLAVDERPEFEKLITAKVNQGKLKP